MRIVAAALLALGLLPAPARAAAADAPPTMLLLHGGAWFAAGPAVTATMAPVGDRFEAIGFRTVAVDYQPGPAGIVDIQGAYDAAARTGGPVCAYGESAGGHWALMLAVLRPDIACVIALAAPTDFADPAALLLRDLGLRALGPDLVPLSPAYFAPLITAPTLLAAGFDDRLVPPGQAERMAAALGGASRVMTLGPGSQRWMHGTASASGVADLEAAELDVAAAAVGLR
jgi:acetyl esterase/lipase